MGEGVGSDEGVTLPLCTATASASAEDNKGETRVTAAAFSRTPSRCYGAIG
jgi:hypothetical protein